MFIKRNKRGQMAIFIIIGILIVLGVLIYFAVRGTISSEGIPLELSPAYDYYSSCIESKVVEAAGISGARGGRIYVENYDYGSDYAPFSSQLNFMGFPVPYWYYMSGNGAIKEQVPSKSDVESDISRYVEEGLSGCDFERFYSEGFSLDIGAPKVKTILNNDKIRVEVESDIFASKGDLSAKKSSHVVEVNSKLGKFYNMALGIYSLQKREAFLENYSVDVLRLYAPVDGVEVGCAPKIWRTDEVIDDLKNGLEANIGALKFDGDYYTLNDKKNNYFVINHKVDESVNLIYSRNWPTKINIVGQGVDDALMIADVVGTQQGVNAMGFCYAPYHFVYDVSFPVMVQFYDNEEIFQFPVAVIIDKNLPRNAAFSEINQSENFDFCSFKTQEMEVNVYNTNLERIDAEIIYGCFDQKCNLGRAVNGEFRGLAPSCVNGYIYARADNYTDAKQIFSSNSETSTDIVLDKEYSVTLNAEVGGRASGENIILLFSGNKIASASLPETDVIKLSEGLYNVTAYVYGNSSIIIPESSKTQCSEIPKSGIAGFFGGTKETCFEINLPATKIDYALIGGGKVETYILSSQLETGVLRIEIPEFAKPSSLEELQYNYESFENGVIYIE